MESLVKSITGVNHLFDFQKASVAQRMSWAARRETTRLEDKVYYLMELFGVNMPLLYGEGEKLSSGSNLKYFRLAMMSLYLLGMTKVEGL